MLYEVLYMVVIMAVRVAVASQESQNGLVQKTSVLSAMSCWPAFGGIMTDAQIPGAGQCDMAERRVAFSMMLFGLSAWVTANSSCWKEQVPSVQYCLGFLHWPQQTAVAGSICNA